MLAEIGKALRLKYNKFTHRKTAATGLKESNSVVISGVRSSIDSGGAVLLHVGKGLMFKSNSTGARIWQGLLDSRDPNRIAEQLSKEYGISLEIVRKDVDVFISALLAHGLLTRSRA